MGIKYIHVTLIVVSIALCLGFGFWALNHNYALCGILFIHDCPWFDCLLCAIHQKNEGFLKWFSARFVLEILRHP